MVSCHNMVSCHPRSRRRQASWPVAKLSFGWIATWTAHAPVRCIFGQPAVAQLVLESLHRGEQLGRYELYAFVVMANHVHVLIHPHLIHPHVDPSRLLKSLKGAIARETKPNSSA
jgi:REP element-mobilizing transposase RayT